LTRQKAGAVFSKSTTPFSQSLLVRRDDVASGRITSYASFAKSGMTIGVVPGTTGENFARQIAKERGVPSSAFVSIPDEQKLIRALLDKKIDAIARGEIGNDYQVSLHKQLLTIERRDFGEAFALAVNPHKPKLVADLNNAIDIVTHQGALSFKAWLKNPQVFDMSVSQHLASKTKAPTQPSHDNSVLRSPKP
jgi:ABC-type amino acid transport substrate-binding protein